MVFVCLFVVYTVTDFSGKDKASGVKFCMVVHGRPVQGIFHLYNFAPAEALKIGRIGQLTGNKVQGGKSFRNRAYQYRAACGRNLGIGPASPACVDIRSSPKTDVLVCFCVFVVLYGYQFLRQ